MRALLLIAGDNIKKKKTDACVIFVLIAIATMFMYVGISVLSSYNREIDNRNKANNGADYIHYTDSESYMDIIDKISDNPHVIDSEATEADVIVSGSYRSSHESDKNAHQTSFLIQKRDDSKRISKVNVIDAGSEWQFNSIIVPYYLYASGDYRTGDTIYIRDGDIELEFIIYGFSEDVLFSTPMNIDVMKLVVSEEMYEQCKNQIGSIHHGVAVILDNYSSDKFMKDVDNDISAFTNKNNFSSSFLTLSYETMKQGTTIPVMIFMALLTLFAVLLIIVVLIIIKFNINTSIEENIKNTGIMEACGYTGRQMITAAMLEFGILGVTGIAFGLIFAGIASGFTGNIISSSMGLIWDMNFSMISALITVISILGFIVLIAYISSRKFKKIAPLDALRNGINSHNFKKNRLRLDKSPFSLNTSLGIKCTLFNLKKNVFLSVVIAILAFVTNVALASVSNFLDSDTLLEISGVEYSDILMQLKPPYTEELENVRAELESMDEIEKTSVFAGHYVTLICGSDEQQVYLNIYDDPGLLETDVLVRGRMPRYDNEIVLSTHVCRKYNLSMGDTIRLKLGNTSYDYIIVGMNQGFSRLGNTGIATLEGDQHIFPDNTGTGIYIYLKDNADISDIIDKLTDIYEKDFTVTNYRNFISTSISTIELALKALCFLLVLVSVIVIALILILLIKTHVIREKRQLGIYKAIGFTTGQLIRQIMISYLPIVLLGSILGNIMAGLLCEKLFVLCFSMYSIEKITIYISPVTYIICTLIIVCWSEIIALLAALRTGRIVPYKMITES